MASSCLWTDHHDAISGTYGRLFRAALDWNTMVFIFGKKMTYCHYNFFKRNLLERKRHVKVNYSRAKNKLKQTKSHSLFLSCAGEWIRPVDFFPQSHLLICSSICRTNNDSPLPRCSGSGPHSLGGGPLASGLLRPSSERTRFDRMSRMVSE